MGGIEGYRQGKKALDLMSHLWDYARVGRVKIRWLSLIILAGLVICCRIMDIWPIYKNLQRYHEINSNGGCFALASY